MNQSAAWILFFSMIHAYVFAFLLFYKKKVGSNILGGYLLICSLQYFLFLNYHLINIKIFEYVYYYLLAPLTLVTFPLIYLYIKKIITDNIDHQKFLILHFLPFTIYLIVIGIVFSSYPAEIKEELLTNLEYIKDPSVSYLLMIFLSSIFILLAQIIFYSIKIFKLFKLHRIKLKQIHSNNDQKSLNWLKVFFVGIIGFYLIDFLMIGLIEEVVNENIYFAITSLHIFFVGIMGLQQKRIYIESEEQPVLVETIIERQSREVVPEELKINIKEKIIHLLESEKVWLDSELSLYDLSKKLEIHKNYLSHIINSEFETNFFNLINAYRVEEAKKRLSNADYNHLTIEGIGQSVGFNSRSVFSTVFKKICGETPGNYKKRTQSKSTESL